MKVYQQVFCYQIYAQLLPNVEQVVLSLGQRFRNFVSITTATSLKLAYTALNPFVYSPASGSVHER